MEQELEQGEYYSRNWKRFVQLTDNDWRAAMLQCRDHIKNRLWNKTKSGVHSAAKLGVEPIDYYLDIAVTKLLNGNWEWKVDYTLGQQLIRVAESYISKAVERLGSGSKGVEIVYTDKDLNFYNWDFDTVPEEEEAFNRAEFMVAHIEAAIQNDPDLLQFWAGVKEGKKRGAIAASMGITPTQLDKVKEKFERRVQGYQTIGR